MIKENFRQLVFSRPLILISIKLRHVKLFIMRPVNQKLVSITHLLFHHSRPQNLKWKQNELYFDTLSLGEQNIPWKFETTKPSSNYSSATVRNFRGFMRITSELLVQCFIASSQWDKINSCTPQNIFTMSEVDKTTYN